MLATICSGIGDMRVREGYVAYLDMLNRLQLHTAASDIVKNSNDQYLMQLSRQGVIMRSSCGKCGKEVGETISSSGSGWCSKCKKCVDLCIFCHKPVFKILTWCPVCGHGGHVQCIDLWFSSNSVCPTGCGHKCMMSTHNLIEVSGREDNENHLEL
jgi:hypothetical protein